MLVRQLHALGVQRGGVLLVHAALSRVGTSPGELIGSVLLLGVGHDCNTTLHVAEAIAGVRSRGCEKTKWCSCTRPAMRRVRSRARL